MTQSNTPDIVDSTPQDQQRMFNIEPTFDVLPGLLVFIRRKNRSTYAENKNAYT